MQCSKIDRKSPNCLTDDNFSLNTPIRCYNSGPLWTCQNTFTNEFFCVDYMYQHLSPSSP